MNSDFKDLLAAFNANGVDYLVFGAHALAAHGMCGKHCGGSSPMGIQRRALLVTQQEAATHLHRCQVSQSHFPECDEPQLDEVRVAFEPWHSSPSPDRPAKAADAKGCRA